jgi:hypothetical protein
MTQQAGAVTMTQTSSDHGSQGTGEQIKEQLQEATRLVSDVAGTVVGDRVRSEIGARSSEIAVETKALAQAMREASRSLKEQGHEAQASLAEDLAGRADRLAAYLRRSDAKTLIADAKTLGREASEFAKKEPLLVTAGAFTLGLLATRWLGSDHS